MHHHQINNIYICFFHYFCCLAFKDSFFSFKDFKMEWCKKLRLRFEIFYLDDDYYYYYDRNGGSLCAGQR